MGITLAAGRGSLYTFRLNKSEDEGFVCVCKRIAFFLAALYFRWKQIPECETENSLGSNISDPVENF